MFRQNKRPKYLLTALITRNWGTSDGVQLGAGVLRMSAATLFAGAFGELHTRLQRENRAINEEFQQRSVQTKQILTVYSVLLKTQTLFGTM